MEDTLKLKALVLVCSLTASPGASSSELFASHLLDEFKQHGVDGETIRAVDYNIKPGVETDMGDGDQWPELRQKMLAADIFIVATPTWVGHMSSVAQRIVERLDAEISETDDQDRPILYDKISNVIVVGNEDGAHKITADLFQALNDVGFTISAQGGTYWNGEAMQKVDYKDLGKIPDSVAQTNRSLAANSAHLARVLKQVPYPAV